MPANIGRFEIVSEIAKSASGAVYKANDPGAGRTLALKTIRLDLPPDLARILVELILQEAESTKVLNSQNIAMLYGAGDINGLFCAAMEYVEGNSLANMMARQEGFTIWDLLDITRQVCLALDHADSHGITHRSLEPAKIMMQWDGTVKVLGYGVSTMVSAMARNGAEVPPLFYYMSPEQVKGEVMDIRSNVFSWGAILYEMVTERKPFNGPSIQVIRQKILEETPEPPATLNPRMNLTVSRVIMQALAKSPEERYQRGQELLLELEKAKQTTQSKQTNPSAQARVVPEELKTATSASGKFVLPQKKKESPQVSLGVKAQEAGPDELTVSPSQAAAAVAGTAVGGSSSSEQALIVTEERSRPPAIGKLSAATEPSTVAEPPKFKIDPMMSEASSSGKKAVSFSDLEELPPLRERYLPPDPPAEIVVEEAEQPGPTFLPTPRAAKADKPKIITRENATKALKEIKQVPPRLMIYSIAAAAAVIVLIILGIAYYIHRQSPEEETNAVSEAVAHSAQPVEQASGPVPVPSQALKPEETNEHPEVSVKPRSTPKKVKVAAPTKVAVIPGELVINSNPEGATVEIDGNADPSWLTPYTVTGLNPGQHTILVGKPGYTSETRAVDVSSGSKSFLAIQLTQLGATVAVSSEPSGAGVYIDGKDIGRLTPTQVTVDKGSHTILVRKQGYLDETTTANMTPGQTFRFSPNLKVMGITDDIRTGGKLKRLFGGDSVAGMGKVTIKTQPKGAQITVNRRMVDKATPLEFMLNSGNYIVDITLSGYRSVHRVINVEKGAKIELNETMEPE